MSTTEKKKIVDEILELLIQLAEDGNSGSARAPSVPADKVEMLTIKDCTEVVQGLSEHTVRLPTLNPLSVQLRLKQYLTSPQPSSSHRAR